MAWEVTPQVNDQGDVVGFDAQQPHEGYGRNSQDDYHMTGDGRVSHMFAGVELADEGEQTAYSEDEYWTNVANLNPDTYEALDWAADHLSQDFIAGYNDAIDRDDHIEANKYLEMIIADYREAMGEPTASEESESDDSEPEPIDPDLVDTVVESLSHEEALGEDVANEWQEAVEQALDSGDEVYAAVAAATASFHSGECTAEQAISYILENYPIEEVARVYQAINQ
jgi:hypothetical protein